MSASQYRGQLERKRKQRIDAERKAGEFRSRESAKRAEAARARQAAAKSTSQSTTKSKLRDAERRDNEAETAGKEAGRWQSRAAAYAKEESSLQARLSRAERSEFEAAERRRQHELREADRRAAAEKALLNSRISETEHVLDRALRQLPAPKPEKLRILVLGASSEGDLRVGREQKRIRSAVESALHRDWIELDVRPAATPSDLMDGITKFRPHVVHFSGHGDEDIIWLEDEKDEPHEGVIVSASVLAKVVRATDSPPLLVLLNSCNSASQIDALVDRVVPFAIGMAEEINDGDAINYAAQFYAAIANGQSINSAHLAAKVRLELDGLDGAELPTLAWAPDVDPAATILVKPTD